MLLFVLEQAWSVEPISIECLAMCTICIQKWAQYISLFTFLSVRWYFLLNNKWLFLFFPNVVTSFMQLIHFSLYYLLLNFGLITMFIAFARKLKTQNSLRPGCLCVCWCCFCVNFIENLYRFIKSHSFLLLHRFSAQ